MTAPRCTRRWCRAIMVEIFAREFGTISFDCPLCQRNRAGICRDCPRRMQHPRKMRCDDCARRSMQKKDAANKREYRADPVIGERLRTQRRRSDAKPAIRQKARERTAKRRKLTPADAFERAYKRAWDREAFADPVYRGTVNRRRRERSRCKQRALAAGLSVTEWRRFDDARAVTS